MGAGVHVRIREGCMWPEERHTHMLPTCSPTAADWMSCSSSQLNCSSSTEPCAIVPCATLKIVLIFFLRGVDDDLLLGAAHGEDARARHWSSRLRLVQRGEARSRRERQRGAHYDVTRGAVVCTKHPQGGERMSQILLAGSRPCIAHDVYRALVPFVSMAHVSPLQRMQFRHAFECEKKEQSASSRHSSSHSSGDA